MTLGCCAGVLLVVVGLVVEQGVEGEGRGFFGNVVGCGGIGGGGKGLVGLVDVLLVLLVGSRGRVVRLFLMIIGCTVYISSMSAAVPTSPIIPPPQPPYHPLLTPHLPLTTTLHQITLYLLLITPLKSTTYQRTILRSYPEQLRLDRLDLLVEMTADREGELLVVEGWGKHGWGLKGKGERGVEQW